jgi:hypothetical protein
VLGTAGTLKFPEMVLQMEMKPGDMAFFLAAQQLRKLSVDSDDPNARQVVLTLWTDQATKFATSSIFAQPYFFNKDGIVQ